ncbi:uncharacterized protein LOC121430060 [Lytechinus variegatus]|uniref:uncharacterized protein LOC121430060 n=1 Tax=Lytechinus variegatus TaxID=7654 RepID=UPI001BB0E4BB|nr:uncharacterized protein LOC121430060 [Lytechinus variegatus]
MPKVKAKKITTAGARKGDDTPKRRPGRPRGPRATSTPASVDLGLGGGNNGPGRSGPVVWIIGDSIVFWAHRRAKNTGEADLGLGTSVRWLGKRGLRIEGVSDWLDKMGRSEPKPSVVVLHVGTNDIEALSKKKLASLTYRLFDANKDKFQIVWSGILERVWYPAGCTGDQGKLDLKRRAANRYAKALAARFHGKAIPHPSISHNDISLYRTDGLHLADEGLDRFISELKVGLSYLR